MQVDKLKVGKVEFIEQIEALSAEVEKAKVELRDLRMFKLQH